MLILANRWRGYLPLLSLIIYKLMLFSVLAEAKPQNIVNLVEDEIFAQRPNSGVVNLDESVTATISSDSFVSENFIDKELAVQNNVIYDSITELTAEVHESIPLNFTLFSFPPKLAKTKDGSDIHIPRYMMEYFAPNVQHARRLPEGATIARSFLVHHIEAKEAGHGGNLESELLKLEEEESEPQKSFTALSTFSHISAERKIPDGVSAFPTEEAQESSAGSNGNTYAAPLYSPLREAHTKPHNHDSSVADKQYYKFAFNLTLPKDEAFHSAHLRTFVRIRRGVHDIAGVERRIRVYVSSSDSESNPSNRSKTNLPIVQKDIYLYDSAWSQIDISPAVSLPQRHPQEIRQTIDVEISADFYVVGGKGELEFHTGLENAFRPFILVFSSRKESKTKFSENQEFSSRKKRNANAVEMEEEETNAIWEGMSSSVWSLSSLDDGKKLGKKARRRRAKNACKRKPLEIVFKDIGWDHWIIAPQSYEAYQCSGKCFYPLASHLTPTKHAVVQNLVHSLHPELAPRACCVPTELGPISLLYLEAGIPTYNYDYSEMVVLGCGCR